MTCTKLLLSATDQMKTPLYVFTSALTITYGAYFEEQSLFNSLYQAKELKLLLISRNIDVPFQKYVLL
jgi:hypothetical protein